MRRISGFIPKTNSTRAAFSLFKTRAATLKSVAAVNNLFVKNIALYAPM